MKNWILVVLGLGIWGLTACSALSEELEMSSSVDVKETANYIRLQPKTTPQKSTGILFYPGGLVDPHAYIQPLQELVTEGYPVLIIKVTGNLAIFNSGKAKQYRDQVSVDRWVIGGHSLGGVIAAYDVRDEPDAYAGLLIWASFPGEAGAIPDWEGAVLSLSAQKDGLTSPEDIDANKKYLPDAVVVTDVAAFPRSSTKGTTIYHEIQGGNHAQFGSYGEQRGDGEASISREQQHDEINTFIRTFLQANQW